MLKFVAMMENVKVEKNPNENSVNLLRRFTRRMQGAGILPRVRSIRYRNRKLSRFLVKKKRLISLKRKGEYEEKVKLGKIPERTIGSHFRRRRR